MELEEKTKDLPLVALVGPTNAGKSTLFNRLTEDYRAITARERSTTRDRVYGQVNWQDKAFILVDTGGLVEQPDELDNLIRQQTEAAVQESDLIVFLYDGKEKLTPQLQQFVQRLAKNKPVWLVANKVDDQKIAESSQDIDYLGLPFSKISAASGRGVGDWLEALTENFPSQPAAKFNHAAMIALIGRPNVGKSSLLNQLAQRERAVVSPIAGTTRDAVISEIEIGGRKCRIVDTAGVRRRGSIEVGVEQFSVRRTLTAIGQADLVLAIADAREGITRGDLHLIHYALGLGKPTLVVFNKADLLKETIPNRQLTKKFPVIFISALKNIQIEQVKSWLEEHLP